MLQLVLRTSIAGGPDVTRVITSSLPPIVKAVNQSAFYDGVKMSRTSVFETDRM